MTRCAASDVPQQPVMRRNRLSRIMALFPRHVTAHSDEVGSFATVAGPTTRAAQGIGLVAAGSLTTSPVVKEPADLSHIAGSEGRSTAPGPFVHTFQGGSEGGHRAWLSCVFGRVFS